MVSQNTKSRWRSWRDKIKVKKIKTLLSKLKSELIASKTNPLIKSLEICQEYISLITKSKREKTFSQSLNVNSWKN